MQWPPENGLSFVVHPPKIVRFFKDINNGTSGQFESREFVKLGFER